jgi:peptide/nickel transport system permease protein
MSKRRTMSERGGEGRRSYSQWQLIWLGFKRHRFALISLFVLAAFYFVAVFCDFLAPYDANQKLGIQFAPPNLVRVFDRATGLQRPFVYGTTQARNPTTFKMEYTVDRATRYPIRLLVRGEPHRLLGFIPTDRHLFGVDAPGAVTIFGTDNLGRDIFSRVLIATRISCSIGLISIAISLVLGLLIGSISALAGGFVDAAIQKVIEVLICIPSIPLWMGLAAALPKKWPPLLVYFAITLILALANWTGVARIVRGKFLSLREEDYITASRNFGAGNWYIITRHLIPNFISYVIVTVTLSIPGAIISETALSFLGIGLRPPIVSWGVMLQGAQNIHSMVEYTWTLIPIAFVVLIVLAYNFVGDGLRDAADPYGRK